MNYISRKIKFFQQSWKLGDTLLDRLRLFLRHPRWILYGKLHHHQPDRLLSYWLRGKNNRMLICKTRDIGSDWIIFNEMFYIGDYDVTRTLGFTPKVIYDLGANCGLAAVWMSLEFPGAHIYGFEPGASELTCARENYRVNRLGTLYPVAVGSENASVPMLAGTEISGGQTLAFDSDKGPEKGEEVVQVDVVAIDSFRKKENLPAPDLIKMDIEGFEAEALRGMPETLAETKAVVLESHNASLHEECLKILTDAGFTVLADEDKGNGYRILMMKRVA